MLAPSPQRKATSDAKRSGHAKKARRRRTTNAPLVDDIRLLGRILGDVIREQEGGAAFELVERMRQLSVAYRLKRDASAGRALDRLLKGLSGDQTGQRDPRLHLFHATSPTWPKTGTTCAAATTTSAQATPRKAIAWRWRSPAAAAGIHADDHRADAGARLDLAGADGAPDRSAAQEHPRRRARHRRAAGGADDRARSAGATPAPAAATRR